jgi:hypothetical protein
MGRTLTEDASHDEGSVLVIGYGSRKNRVDARWVDERDRQRVPMGRHNTMLNEPARRSITRMPYTRRSLASFLTRMARTPRASIGKLSTVVGRPAPTARDERKLVALRPDDDLHAPVRRAALHRPPTPAAWDSIVGDFLKRYPEVRLDESDSP